MNDIEKASAKREVGMSIPIPVYKIKLWHIPAQLVFYVSLGAGLKTGFKMAIEDWKASK